MAVVLLLDDQDRVLTDLGGRLRRKGFAVHAAESIPVAEKIVRSETLDFAVVDLKLDYRSEYGGIGFIKFLKRNQPKTKVIVLSGHHRHEAVALGAVFEAWASKTDPDENYITCVIRCLDGLVDAPPTKRCFVIMPMSKSRSCREDQWTEVFEGMIRPAVEACGFVCTRSQGRAGNIIKLILDDLNRADLVVADVTDRNPNVFYELGVRHALRDSTLVIAQSLDHVPFDLRPYSVIIYDWTTNAGKGEFAGELKKALDETERRPAAKISPVREYLQP